MVISDFDEVVHFAGYTPIFLLHVRRFNTAADSCCFFSSEHFNRDSRLCFQND